MSNLAQAVRPIGPLPDDSGGNTHVYTVDLGDGRVADVEGPANATPEQLQAALTQQSALPPVQRQPDAPDQMEQHFADEMPTETRRRLSPDDEAQYRQLLHTADGPTLRRFLTQRGFDSHGLDGFVTMRDRARAHGGRVNYGLDYLLPRPTETTRAASLATGAADTLTFGTIPKLNAAAQAAGDALTGADSFSDSYDRNLDINHGVIAAQEEDHPWFRVAGQIIGGLPMPAGLEGVGLSAGTDVLRAGGTMRDARAAAAIAVRNRMATVGGAYGGAHGVGSADTPGQALIGGLTEAALGAATAGLMGHAGGRSGKPVATAVGDAEQGVQGATSATPAQAADIAARYGIAPTPATVGGAGAHAGQMALGNLPGGMTAVARGVDRENTGVSQAVGSIADQVGPISTREGAGRAAVEGAQAYSASSRAEGRSLYATRDRLMGGDTAPVTLDDTQRQIADIASRYPTSATLAALMQHPVIRRIAGVVGDAGQDGEPVHELTLAEATDALSHVRGVSRALARNGADSDQITARVNDVKNALSSDVMRAAGAADMAAGRAPGAEGSAVTAQRSADAFWADRKQALAGTFKTALTAGARSTEVPAERVYGQIDQDTLRVGGNLARLRDTWFRLPEPARNTIAATKIDDMGRSLPGQQNHAGDAWSYDRFLTNFDRMSPQARNIMFGARAADQLGEIAAYSSRLRDLGRSRNFSNTAKNLISGAILTTVGSALWHGAPMEAVGAAASIPASYAAASLFLRTPAMRQWTRAALRAALITDPQRSATVGRALVAGLPSIARAEPAIANEVLGLQRRLATAFEAGPVHATADEGGNHRSGADRNQIQQESQPNELQP